jgi:uncharacterized membrane protein YqjE
MREFFLQHICTTPPYTLATCEEQYRWLATIGIATLVLLGIAALAYLWEFRFQER